MKRIIDLELPEKYFEKDQEDKLAARLAKFNIKKGDILRFNEINKKGERTGKFYDKIIKDFHKIHKATKYWSKKDLTKYGIYIFVLGKPRQGSKSKSK